MSEFSRRKVLKLAAATAAAAVPLSGCERLISKVTRELGQTIPEKIDTKVIESDPVAHLLRRATYGIWPGDLENARAAGAKEWLEQQLNPEKIADFLCEARARRFESIHFDPAFCYEFKKQTLRSDLLRHNLLRAIYSRRQLQEVMVGFWTDHLNISIEKGDCIYLKATDERTVIRPHALGKFRDLIAGSAVSPAMLIYLDGKENKKATPQDVPNENYARELLELHTLGVDGGYTQKDVFEVARCLTGWTVKDGSSRGKSVFEHTLHDNGEKHVLGHAIPGGQGERDLELVIDIACRHPSTAHYISKKLAQKFVGDPPAESLVKRLASEFTRTDGDIKSVLRVLFNSSEFSCAPEQKLKRPFHYMVSCLRACGADTHARQELVDYLERMGQATYQYPTPDGYPEEAQPWVGTLLWRWNFAMALASNTIPGVVVNLDRLAGAINITGLDSDMFSVQSLTSYFFGKDGTTNERQALQSFIDTEGLKSRERKAELVGLILASPSFQRY